jgi:hypothetical protein
MAGIKGRSGGARSGSGRKALNASALRLAGGEDRGVVRPVAVPGAMVACPVAASAAVAAAWAELAPHAVHACTLVPGTASAFLRLCQAVVKHAQMEQQIERDGLTYYKVTIDGSGQEHQELKAHPLIARAEAIDNKIRGWFKDFAINPFGKPLAEAIQKPVNPFARFGKGA